jgi:DNA-binding response OmpR family regulator
MKILIAEDEPLILMALERQLKKDGYEVIITMDGREALLVLDKIEPDLIITDILMPFTSGLELIGILKSTSKKNIPILVLSAMGQENILLEAFQLGADDFVTKPFNPIELTTRVKRLLGVHAK